MKCLRDTVTLLCPAAGGYTEYLLKNVMLSVKEANYSRGETLFVIPVRSRCLRGAVEVPLPPIFTGCKVALGDLRGFLPEDEPDGRFASVVAVEMFKSMTGRGDHLKVTLG